MDSPQIAASALRPWPATRSLDHERLRRLAGDGGGCWIRVAGLCLGDGGAGRIIAVLLESAPPQRGRSRPAAGLPWCPPMSRKRRRLLALVVGLVLLGSATALVLAAFN